MPRAGKGGSRQGTPGTSYSNRTDLNMPISTVPNQGYGEAAQQRAAQGAVPMAASPVATAPAAAPQQQSAPMAQPQQDVTPMARPGSLPHLEPTMRPNEPVTAGLPFGPGPGEQLATPAYPTMGQTFEQIARGGDSAIAIELAKTARMLGL